MYVCLTKVPPHRKCYLGRSLLFPLCALLLTTE